MPPSPPTEARLFDMTSVIGFWVFSYSFSVMTTPLGLGMRLLIDVDDSSGFVILMMPLVEHLRAIRAQSDNCITIGRSTVSVGCQITGGMRIGLSVRDNSYLAMGCLLLIYVCTNHEACVV